MEFYCFGCQSAHFAPKPKRDSDSGRKELAGWEKVPQELRAAAQTLARPPCDGRPPMPSAADIPQAVPISGPVDLVVFSIVSAGPAALAQTMTGLAATRELNKWKIACAERAIQHFRDLKEKLGAYASDAPIVIADVGRSIDQKLRDLSTEVRELSTALRDFDKIEAAINARASAAPPDAGSSAGFIDWLFG